MSINPSNFFGTPQAATHCSRAAASCTTEFQIWYNKKTAELQFG